MYKYEKVENFNFSKSVSSRCKNIFKNLFNKIRKNRNFDAIKFLLICAIIVGSMVTISIAVSVFQKGDNSLRFSDYDNFIWPVVMQNPESFDEYHPIDTESMISAAVWRAAMDLKSDSERFNKDQKLVLDFWEVSQACVELFGGNFSHSDISNVESNFFEFDFENNKFLINSISGVGNYVPHTVNAYRKGGETVLKVGYVVPAESFDSDMSTFSENKVEKYKIYHLKTDKNSGNMYISSME